MEFISIVYSLLVCVHAFITSSSAATFSMSSRRLQDNQNQAPFSNTGSGFRQMENEKQKFDGPYLNQAQRQSFNQPRQNINAGRSHFEPADPLHPGIGMHNNFKPVGFHSNPVNPIPNSYLSSQQHKPEFGINTNIPNNNEKQQFNSQHSFNGFSHPQQPTERYFDSKTNQHYDAFGNPIAKTAFHNVEGSDITETEVNNLNDQTAPINNIYTDNGKVLSELSTTHSIQESQNIPDINTEGNLSQFQTTGNSQSTNYPVQNAVLSSSVLHETNKDENDPMHQPTNAADSEALLANTPDSSIGTTNLEDSEQQSLNVQESIDAPEAIPHDPMSISGIDVPERQFSNPDESVAELTSTNSSQFEEPAHQFPNSDESESASANHEPIASLNLENSSSIQYANTQPDPVYDSKNIEHSDNPAQPLLNADDPEAARADTLHDSMNNSNLDAPVQQFPTSVDSVAETDNDPKSPINNLNSFESENQFQNTPGTVFEPTDKPIATSGLNDPVNHFSNTDESLTESADSIVFDPGYASQNQDQEGIPSAEKDIEDNSIDTDDNFLSQNQPQNTPVVSEVSNEQLSPETMNEKSISDNQQEDGVENQEFNSNFETSFSTEENRNTDAEITGEVDDVPIVENNDENHTYANSMNDDTKKITTPHMEITTQDTKTDGEEETTNTVNSFNDDNTQHEIVNDDENTEFVTKQLPVDVPGQTNANDIGNEVTEAVSNYIENNTEEPGNTPDEDENTQDREPATTSENEYTKSINAEGDLEQAATHPQEVVTEINGEEAQTHELEEAEDVTKDPELIEESSDAQTQDVEEGGREEVTQDPELLLFEEKSTNNDINPKFFGKEKYQESLFKDIEADQKYKFGDTFVLGTNKKSLFPFLMLLLLVVLLLLVCSRMPSYFYSTWIAVKNHKFDHFNLKGKRSKRGYSALSMGDKSV